MSEPLTDIELRRAVAEAVGWEWVEHLCAATDGTMSRFAKVYVSWDDAIAACEAMGMFGEKFKVIIGNGEVVVAIKVQLDDICTGWKMIGVAEGTSPESLCRALLAALEATTEGKDE